MLSVPRADISENSWDFETQPLVKATGFREYDARWLFGPEINLLGIQALGLGLGTYMHELGQTRIVVGHDAGAMVNPAGVQHQVHGNVLQTTRIELPLAPVPAEGLAAGARRSELERPARIEGNLLVAGKIRRRGHRTRVFLVSRRATPVPLRQHALMYLPATPPAPRLSAHGSEWRIRSGVPGILYRNGRRIGPISRTLVLAQGRGLQCFSVTALGRAGHDLIAHAEVAAAVGDEGIDFVEPMPSVAIAEFALAYLRQ